MRDVTDSPSALLERAAALIEQRATAFRAPQHWGREVRGADMSEAGAAWAKLFGPVSAQPLVEWLQHEAAGAEGGYFDPAPHAVAFAKLVLGES